VGIATGLGCWASAVVNAKVKTIAAEIEIKPYRISIYLLLEPILESGSAPESYARRDFSADQRECSPR
jgi:hypothetical protein